MADAVSRSIEVMLRLTGRVAVRRADFLLPIVDIEPAAIYYSEVDAWRAVYGAINETPDR